MSILLEGKHIRSRRLMVEEQANQSAQRQRRASYRVPIDPDSELRIRIWRIGAHAILRDRPSAKLEMISQPRDLSVTGLGVLLRPRDVQSPTPLAAGERLRIQINWEGQEIVVEGNITHAAPANDQGWARVGVVFKKLDGNIEGRKTQAFLSGVVGQLQRAETRRVRLGLRPAAT